MRARVLIRPKEGILDPQGQTVERALPALGFEGASHVRIGRLVELEVDDASQVPAMCEKLLANPLIEDYEVQLLDGPEGGNGSDPAR
ncbi:MAG TPA: phosphoribosylformylglycinamidine synthase subunit PurS [Thermoleophilaceae bacterium]|nr:phosphoribosylformylglycinamidine synthase subunit PurS [Thermoleophilaceae bacterium]